MCLKTWQKTTVGTLLAIGLTGLTHTAAAVDSPTIEAIKERGELACGVGQGNRHGFSAPDDSGVWRGIDTDFCRAMAVAVLGDADKVKYVPLSSVQRFPALQSGDIDILIRVTTWTFSRDSKLGLQFTQPYFFTGLALMVPKALGVESAKELDGAAICLFPGTSSEKAISAFFTANDMEYEPVTIENAKERDEAYLSGRCDAMVSFLPGLAIVRAFVADNPDEHVILPELLEKEPLGFVVRQGDDAFLDIANWVLFATLEAEELGVTSENIDRLREESNAPKILRLVGEEPGFGEPLGLREDWAYDVIKQLGNYEEIYNRNVGTESKLNIPRQFNRLWNDDGLLYSVPWN